MLRTLIQIVVLVIMAAASLRAVEPNIAIAVTSNGQPVNEGQTVSGVVNITVTVTNGIDMHVATYGNMIFLPFNEPGHRATTAVWSHTTQVDTRRFYDGENLLSVHVHPHNHAGETYGSDFTFGTFKLISENSNPAPNGDRLLPTLTVSSGFLDWTPKLTGGEYYLSGDASVVDDKTSSGVGREFTTAAPVQIIAHLGESVLGRFRWNTLTPPFGDQSLVSQCHLRPFQHDYEFDTKVVFFFTDGAGRANYATRAFRMPALPTTPGIDLPLPHLDAKILGLGDGDTLRVPDGGTAPLYVQVSNLTPGAWTYTEMTTWIGNRAVKVTNLLPYLQTLPEGTTSVIVEVPIPADEVQRLQNARQGGEMSTATPIWVDFNQGNIPCLPVSSHIHLNSVRTTSYPWPYGQATVVIRKPWNNSGHWTGTTLAARYDQWGPLPAGYRVRWKLNNGAWQVDDGDGVISLSGLTRQSHLLEVELTDAALVRLPGSGSFSAANFTVTDAAPVAVANSYSVVVNTTLNVTGSGVLANDQDADGDSMTALLVSQSRHGTVSLASNGSFTYAPAPGFVGFDRFSYRASDGTLSSEETDVRIQVTAFNSGARVFGDWPMLGRDAEHAGYIGGFLGTTAPTLSWTASFPPGSNTVNRIRGSAVVGGRVVTSIDYYAYGQIRVACFNATSGQREWETLFNKGDVSAPAIGNGYVYVQRANHSSDSQMIALDLTSGAVRWSTPYADQWSADWAPTVADGSLWVSGGYYGGLYGYDAITGAQRFFQTLPQFDNWTPAYRGGKLFTWLQGTVRRHHALTGAVELSKVLKSTNAANGYVNAMPVLVEDRLVLRDEQRLIVVDPTDFSVHWQRMPLAGSWARTPVVHDGIVYALTGNSLEALDLASGRQLGVVALPNASTFAPIVTDDMIIVSCFASYPNNDQTLVIDRATLTVRHTLPYGGPLALADNALYITDSGSNIASPSVRKYTFAVAPPVNQPPVALADAFSTLENNALTISTVALLANDSDADGNPLSVQVVSQPAIGTLTAITGGYRYDPPLNWYGTTTFTYVANDSQASSQPATVTITVEDVPSGFDADLFNELATIVTLTSIDTQAVESGDTALVTITRTGEVTNALDVYLTYSGTATNGVDVRLIPALVTIPAGQSSLAVVIDPVQDGVAENSETVILALAFGPGYGIGAAKQVTCTVVDDEPVTITVTGIDKNLGEPSDPGKFRVSRSGPVTAALTVGLGWSGTATIGTDTAVLPSSVTIPANSVYTDITVNVTNDTIPEDRETVILTALAGPGYQIGVGSATGTIADEELESIGIEAVTPYLVEVNNLVTTTFRVYRTGNSATARTLTYSVSGSTTAGTDYTALSGSVTLGSNSSSSTINVTTKSDSINEGNESIVLTLNTLPVGVGLLQSTASVDILDNNDPSRPSVTLSSTNAREGSNNGSFTVSRTGSTATSLRVNFAPVTGSAIAGSDYTALPGYVDIPVGQSSASVSVAVLNDAVVEAQETITLAIAVDPAYTIGSSSKTVNIADNEIPTLTVTVNDGTAAEPGTDTAKFTITRTKGDLSQALTGIIGSEGTAVAGSDYLALPSIVVLPANSASVSVTLTALDDSVAELNETVAIRIIPDASYQLGGAAAGTITIKDNEAPVLDVIALDASATENGDTGKFRIQRRGNQSPALTVGLAWSGTALNGTDINTLATSTSLAANAATADITVTPKQDTSVEEAETVLGMINPGSGYTVGSSTATVLLADDEPGTVSIRVVPPSAFEIGGEPGAFEVYRTGSLATAITVTYTIQGTAAVNELNPPRSVTLPVGVDRVRMIVTPLSDALVEADESVIIRLEAGPGYNLGTIIEATFIIDDGSSG